MPPNNTIVTRLTADPRDMQRGFSDGRKAADDFANHLARVDQKLQATTTRMTNGGRGRNIGGGLANGALELSRGLEDAAVGYQLNGIQGAVRGASNNFSQLAFVMGGPVLGAIVGLTAAALPSLINYFTNAEAKAADLKKRLDSMRESMDRVAEAARARVQFEGLLKGLDNGKDLEAQIERKQQQLRELEEAQKALEGQRAAKGRLGADGRMFIWQDRADANVAEEIAKREKEIRERQNETLAERVRLENEINVLISKRPGLQEQDKDAEDFKRRQQQADEMERKRERDSQHIEGLLQGRLQGLGGKVDPLEGLDAPRGLQGRIARLLEQADELNKKPLAQFAQVATAGSQSLLRSQEQAKQAAKAERQREQLRQEIRDALRELKELRRAQQNEAEKDDVNLT